MPSSAAMATTAGRHQLRRRYKIAAGSRVYRLFTPSGYHGQAIPLVIMLHGCTQSPEDFAAGTRMNFIPAGMPTPAPSTAIPMVVASWSTGKSTEPDMHGREAAQPAPTPIRTDRTQQGRCCVSSSSIRFPKELNQFSGSAHPRFILSKAGATPFPSDEAKRLFRDQLELLKCSNCPQLHHSRQSLEVSCIPRRTTKPAQPELSGRHAFQYIRGKAKAGLCQRKVVRADLAAHPIGLDLECYFLSLGESGQTSTLDCADVHKDIVAAIVRLDKSKALLAIEPFYGTCRHSLLQAHMRVRRAPIARTTSTSTMSLEKEPAGAFNKAQRLIE